MLHITDIIYQHGRDKDSAGNKLPTELFIDDTIPMPIDYITDTISDLYAPVLNYQVEKMQEENQK